MDIVGILEFVINTSGDLTKNPRLTLVFTGQDLGVKGGSFKESSVGPLRFSVKNEAEVDLSKRKVTIGKGEVRFLERSAISWYGSIEKTDGGAVADATVGPLSIDVGEVYRTAKPFLLEDVGLDLEGLSRAHALTVGTIKVSGSIPKGVLTVLLNDLTLRVPTVNLKQKEMSISSEESSLSVNNLRVALKDLFPSQAVGCHVLPSERPSGQGSEGGDRETDRCSLLGGFGIGYPKREGGPLRRDRPHRLEGSSMVRCAFGSRDSGNKRSETISLCRGISPTGKVG